MRILLKTNPLGQQLYMIENLMSEAKRQAIADFLELARVGHVNRKTIIEGWRRYYQVTQFVPHLEPNPVEMIYGSLVNPDSFSQNPDPLHTFAVRYLSPNNLLKGLEWEQESMERASRFCSALLEVTSRLKLDEKYPPEANNT